MLCKTWLRLEVFKFYAFNLDVDLNITVVKSVGHSSQYQGIRLEV